MKITPWLAFMIADEDGLAWKSLHNSLESAIDKKNKNDKVFYVEIFPKKEYQYIAVSLGEKAKRKK